MVRGEPRRLCVRPGEQFPPGSSARQPSCRGEATVYSVGRSARVFRDFRYRTLDSWSRERRAVGKAEHTPDSANPRFVVTSLRRPSRRSSHPRREPVLRPRRGREPHRFLPVTRYICAMIISGRLLKDDWWIRRTSGPSSQVRRSAHLEPVPSTGSSVGQRALTQ